MHVFQITILCFLTLLQLSNNYPPYDTDIRQQPSSNRLYRRVLSGRSRHKRGTTHTDSRTCRRNLFGVGWTAAYYNAQEYWSWVTWNYIQSAPVLYEFTIMCDYQGENLWLHPITLAGYKVPHGGGEPVMDMGKMLYWNYMTLNKKIIRIDAYGTTKPDNSITRWKFWEGEGHTKLEGRKEIHPGCPTGYEVIGMKGTFSDYNGEMDYMEHIEPICRVIT